MEVITKGRRIKERRFIYVGRPSLGGAAFVNADEEGNTYLLLSVVFVLLGSSLVDGVYLYGRLFFVDKGPG